MKTVVLGSEQDGYNDLFADYGPVINASPYEYLKIDFDLLCFIGGNDLHPAFYGHKTHPTTYASLELDYACHSWYLRAKHLRVPCVGICKGAQQLAVFNGGALYQNVDNHTKEHLVKPILPEGHPQFKVTSSHHQMIDWSTVTNVQLLVDTDPSICDNRIIYSLSKRKFVNVKGSHIVEPEVLWFHKTRDLAVQYHPEWMDKESYGWKYFQWLIKEYINVK